MIEPMYKYYFLVPQGDYLRFLMRLRQLGVLHVKGNGGERPSELQDRLEAQNRLQQVLDLLAKREVQPRAWEEPLPEDGLELMKRYEDWTDKVDDRIQELEQLDKQLEQWRPWGDFSKETLDELAGAGLYVHFFSCPAKRWKPGWTAEYPIAFIAEENGQAHFIYLSREAEPPELLFADAWPPPPQGTRELRERRRRLEDEKAAWNDRLDQLAAHGIPAMEAALYKLQDHVQFREVVHHSRQEADGHLMLLEGFVPDSRRQSLEAFLHDAKVLFLRDRPKPQDNPPVLLRNSGFSRLFEPIGELFSLPDYAEMDLTPYFAPFFMMFFGFCLGDAGYGLVMVLGATIYRRFAREGLQPILRLLQWLGLATVIFGALTGTLFGLNLLENPLPGLEAARNFMLDSNQAFQLALVLGLVQILFGLVLKAMNQARQYGWMHGIAPIGWMILLLSLLDIGLLKQLGPVSTYTAWAGVALIVLFSDPSVGLPGRVGKGLWELYGITGFFGDLLSYIRLFALGISSAILGYVVNNIAWQINQGVPYVGPVLFVLFLVVGHGANLLIASLGAFVHPMRLTFVEFYKNAGFKGGGRKYDPLRKHGTET